ncbi:MAG TPA: hypothetical protein PKX33_01815 [Candidatus Paceibacterota bacterium]|nr:hypothetical protein [Candidatus Paceibacterota bacterium]
MLSLGSRSNIALKPLKNKKMERITKEKMGEIALVILKERAKRERIPNANELKRVLGNVSKDLGIPQKDLACFWVNLYQKIFEETISSAKKIIFDE